MNIPKIATEIRLTGFIFVLLVFMMKIGYHKFDKNERYFNSNQPIDIVKDFGNEILEYYRNGRLEDWMDERLDLFFGNRDSRSLLHKLNQ